MLTKILVLIFLIFINSFFSSSEVALISLNENKIKQMAKDGNKNAQILIFLLNKSYKFISMIQIGLKLAGFLASAFASGIFAEEFVKILEPFQLPLSDLSIKYIGITLITVLFSFFIIFVGEFIPKKIAMRYPESIAMFNAKPLKILLLATLPFAMFFSFFTNQFARIFGINLHEEYEEITEAEIRLMVDAGEETGAIHEDEKHMINNIFEFNNKTVMEVVIHRTDIVSLPCDSTFEEVISCVTKEKFSRIPIYENSIDNIVGILYSKDLFQFLDESQNKKLFDLKSMIREACFVPFSKKTDELFREMKEKNFHIAIILDEYGGTAGLVSMEDLIEEIVGNIFDEDDEIEKEIEIIDENTIIVRGNMNLDDLKEIINIDFDDSFHDTLSGFLTGKTRKIPTEGEQICLDFGNYNFEVLGIDEKKISKVKISKLMNF